MEILKQVSLLPCLVLGVVVAYLFYVERRVRLLRRHYKRMHLADRMPPLAEEST